VAATKKTNARPPFFLFLSHRQGVPQAHAAVLGRRHEDGQLGVEAHGAEVVRVALEHLLVLFLCLVFFPAAFLCCVSERGR